MLEISLSSLRRTERLFKRAFRIAIGAAALTMLAPLPSLAEVSRIEERSTLTLPSGRKLEARILVPSGKAREGGRFASVMVFGGFQEAGKVLELVDTPEPVVLASFDYPFDGSRSFRFPQSLTLIPEAKRTIHETVEGIGLLAQLLSRREDVDPQRITVLGASLGAPFAVLAAERSSSIQGLAVVHGFGDVPLMLRGELLRVSKLPSWISHPLFWAVSELGWWYLGIESPESAARRLRIGQKVLVIEAENDSLVPFDVRKSFGEAFSASGARVSRVSHPGDHLRRGSQRMIRQIMGMVGDWMWRERLLN